MAARASRLGPNPAPEARPGRLRLALWRRGSRAMCIERFLCRALPGAAGAERSDFRTSGLAAGAARVFERLTVGRL